MAEASETTASNASERGKLGLLAAISYVIANIVGSGIFITPTGILKRCNSVGLSLAIWTICGLLSLLGALCYVELGTSIRQSGSDFAYQSYVGWHPIAFALTFTLLFFRFPCTAAVLMETVGTYFLYSLNSVLAISDWASLLSERLVGLLIFCKFYEKKNITGKQEFFLSVSRLVHMAQYVFGGKICGETASGFTVCEIGRFDHNHRHRTVLHHCWYCTIVTCLSSLTFLSFPNL